MTWPTTSTHGIPALTYWRLLAYWQNDRDKLQRVRALHVATDSANTSRTYCDECFGEWPCPTIVAIGEEK